MRPWVAICHDGTEYEFTDAHAWLDWFLFRGGMALQACLIKPEVLEDLDEPCPFLEST